MNDDTEYSKKRRVRFKEKHGSEYTRNAHLKSKYGMTLEQQNEMLKNQDNKCPICGSIISGENIAIDHNHNCCPGTKTCGECIRGIICRLCNQGLGSFRDNIDFLKSAVVYLQGR